MGSSTIGAVTREAIWSTLARTCPSRVHGLTTQSQYVRRIATTATPTIAAVRR
jgi:hypothetical protein